MNYLLVGNYKKELSDVKFRPRIKIPEDIRDKKYYSGGNLYPIDYGRMFKANFTYQAEKEPLGLDKDNVMGIDLGVNILG